MNNKTQQTTIYIFLMLFILMICVSFDAFAVTTTELKEPMKDLKKEVFDWMYAIKIAAVGVGGVFSLIKQSLTPFGIGGGITAGIAFFDKFIGDGSAALIG